MYKKPPRYDMVLAEKARIIITYALFLHFAFGFYMFSNSAIFTYTGNFSLISGVKQNIDQYVQKYYYQNNYISITRLTQTHSIIYLMGFALFIILFILN